MAKYSWRTLIGGGFGSLLEWYDYSLYGFLAPIFAKLFFPHYSPTAQLIATFSAFGIAYLGRPVGALAFGKVADKFGRQPMLVLSVVAMGISTTLLGFLPTYSSVGILAPLLLVCVRFLQGLSVGGEYMGSAVYLTESAPPHKRGRWASTVNIFSGMGVLCAALSSTAISLLFAPEELQSWGWRLPFFCAFIAAAFGVVMRLTLQESPIFVQLKAAKQLTRYPVKHAFSTQFRAMVRGFGLVWLQSVAFYIPIIFLNSWMVQYAHVQLPNALTSTSMGMFITLMGTLLGGIFSDRWGRRPILISVSLLFLFGAYPTFYFMTSASADPLLRFFCGQCFLSFVFGLYNGCLPSALTELFAARSRCTAMTLSYNGAAGILGGFTPLACTLLILFTRDSNSPAFYLMLPAFIALLILLRIKETFNLPLRK